MSDLNRVTLNIPETDVQEIEAAMSVIMKKLIPHMKIISEKERMSIAKMGDKTIAFVQKALEYCEKNPELAPKFLDAAEFNRDMISVELLRRLETQLEQALMCVTDTKHLAGADAYKEARAFYNAVKSAMDSNMPKAETIYNDLSARFKKSQSENKNGVEIDAKNS